MWASVSIGNLYMMPLYDDVILRYSLTFKTSHILNAMSFQLMRLFFNLFYLKKCGVQIPNRILK